MIYPFFFSCPKHRRRELRRPASHAYHQFPHPFLSLAPIYVYIYYMYMCVCVCVTVCTALRSVVSVRTSKARYIPTKHPRGFLLSTGLYTATYFHPSIHSFVRRFIPSRNIGGGWLGPSARQPAKDCHLYFTPSDVAYFSQLVSR